VTSLYWNVVSFHLETLLTLKQDKCMVCAERTKGSEIVLDASDGTQVTRLKWKLVSVHLEVVLVSMQEWYTICAKCTIGSEIVFDAPDGTPT
jgi:hypothetical protein